MQTLPTSRTEAQTSPAQTPHSRICLCSIQTHFLIPLTTANETTPSIDLTREIAVLTLLFGCNAHRVFATSWSRFSGFADASRWRMGGCGQDPHAIYLTFTFFSGRTTTAPPCGRARFHSSWELGADDCRSARLWQNDSLRDVQFTT
jgi:hypothetical protein